MQKSRLEIRKHCGPTPVARGSSGANVPLLAARPKRDLQLPWDLLPNSLLWTRDKRSGCSPGASRELEGSDQKFPRILTGSFPVVPVLFEIGRPPLTIWHWTSIFTCFVRSDISFPMFYCAWTSLCFHFGWDQSSIFSIFQRFFLRLHGQPSRSDLAPFPPFLRLDVSSIWYWTLMSRHWSLISERGDVWSQKQWKK